MAQPLPERDDQLALLESVLASAPVGFAVLDRELRYLRVNAAFAEVNGVAVEAHLGRTLFEIVPEIAAEVAPLYRCVLETGEPMLNVDVDGAFIGRPEERRRWLASIYPVRGADGAVRALAIVSTEFTNERRAEDELRESRAALRASEERFRVLYERAAVGIAMSSREGPVLAANPAYCEMLGYSEAELRTMSNIDIVHPDERAAQRESLARLLSGELRTHVAEKRYLRKDGSVVWGRTTVSVIPDSAGVPRQFIAVAEDVSERRRTEEALRESETRFAHIAANVPGMVYQYVYRADGTRGYTFVSEGARTLFGVAPEDAIRDQAVLLGLLHPDEREEFVARARAAAATLGSFRWEGRVLLPGGQERFVIIVARAARLPDGSVASDGMVTDMTELRRAQERLAESEQRLRQAQKMEAVGRLAGGVAHDFNNLLTVIQNCTAFGIEQLAPESPARAELAQALRASERAAALTRQLLAFSRQQVLKPRLLGLNETVTSVAELLRRLIGEDVVLETALAPSVVPVLADPGQLTQVLMNLAVNARDAMRDGGTLRIGTGATRLPGAAADSGVLAAAKLPPGDYAMLVVEDTGSGIPAELLPRIFEPFYTTKGVGRGTGLGLSTVYGIVAQSGGEILVESTPGVGTRFVVLLPLAKSVELPPEHPVAQARSGTEAILLIEDEPEVRSVVRRQLERLGYAVHEAGSGEAALRVAASDAPIDLVLTDLVMPGLSGRALVAELRALRPALRVVFMSGYTDDEVIRRGLTEPGAVFLEKPFVTGRLAESIREALDAA